MQRIRRVAVVIAALALVVLAGCTRAGNAAIQVTLPTLLTSPAHCLRGQGLLEPVELVGLDLAAARTRGVAGCGTLERSAHVY